MISKEIIWILAGLLGALSLWVYIVQIIRGKMQPERASWFIWWIVGILLFTSYDLSGAKNTIWLPLVYAIGPFIIFLLSLKYWVWWWNLFDKWVLFLCGVCGLVWWISGDAFLALLCAGFIDILGHFPTIKKVFHKPLSEDKPAWIMWWSAQILNILAIEVWTFNVYFPPFYMFFFTGIIIILMFFPTLKTKLN